MHIFYQDLPTLGWVKHGPEKLIRMFICFLRGMLGYDTCPRRGASWICVDGLELGPGIDTVVFWD